MSVRMFCCFRGVRSSAVLPPSSMTRNISVLSCMPGAAGGKLSMDVWWDVKYMGWWALKYIVSGNRRFFFLRGGGGGWADRNCRESERVWEWMFWLLLIDWNGFFFLKFWNFVNWLKWGFFLKKKFEIDWNEFFFWNFEILLIDWNEVFFFWNRKTRNGVFFAHWILRDVVFLSFLPWPLPWP